MTPVCDTAPLPSPTGSSLEGSTWLGHGWDLTITAVAWRGPWQGCPAFGTRWSRLLCQAGEQLPSSPGAWEQGAGMGIPQRGALPPDPRAGGFCTVLRMLLGQQTPSDLSSGVRVSPHLHHHQVRGSHRLGGLGQEEPNRHGPGGQSRTCTPPLCLGTALIITPVCLRRISSLNHQILTSEM